MKGMAWALSPGPLTHQESPSSLIPWMAGESVVEGRWADGLWAELGKDGLPQGRITAHLRAVWESSTSAEFQGLGR